MSSKIDPIKNVPSKESSSEQWLLWYSSLKSAVGHDEAVNLFIDTWKQRGTDEANTSTLRDTMAKEGVKIGADWQDIVLDALYAPVGFIGGILDLSKKLGIGVSIVIGLFVLAILGAIIMFFFKSASNPKMVIETVGAVAKAGAI